MNNTNHSQSTPALTPILKEERRSSWGGPENTKDLTGSPDAPLSFRRSLAGIFSSMGKAGRQRRKPMTSSESPHRKVTSPGGSQFYVDLPNTCILASPQIPQPAIEIIGPLSITDQTNEENKSPNKTPTKNGSHYQVQKHSPVSSRGVLVIPEAAREAKAYLKRVQLAEQDASMGIAASAESEEVEEACEVRESMPLYVTPHVTQNYGSVLAELTQKYPTQRRYQPSSVPHLVHILPRAYSAHPSHPFPATAPPRIPFQSNRRGREKMLHECGTESQNTENVCDNETKNQDYVYSMSRENACASESQNIYDTNETESQNFVYSRQKDLGESQNVTSENQNFVYSGQNVNPGDVAPIYLEKFEGRTRERVVCGAEINTDMPNNIDSSSDEDFSEMRTAIDEVDRGLRNADSENSSINSDKNTVDIKRDDVIDCESDKLECRGEPDGECSESDGGSEEKLDLITPTITFDPPNTLTNNIGDNDGLNIVPKINTDCTPSSTDVTPGPSPELTSQEKRDRKIFLIAQEVMTSERVFVNVLKLLNVEFRNFILNWGKGDNPEGTTNGNNTLSPLIPLQDLDRILNYLPQLQNLNEEILSDLEKSITDWEGRRKIADVIVRKGPFLKLYSCYIREFQAQCEHLDNCTSIYPNFAKALKDFEASERCHKLGVKHYMLKPVQRIPQYRLLLEQYLKTIGQDSPDYIDTQNALAVVENVAAHANTTLKQGTNFMKLLALQDRLSSSSSTSSETPDGGSGTRGLRYELIKPGRYLLKEGELLKLCRREMQPRYFILLSDVLLYTSQVTGGPGGALKLNYELTLEGMRVETPKAEDFKNEFSVISTSRSFTLQANTAEERDEWLVALRDAITDNAYRRSSFLQAKLPAYQGPTSLTLGKQAPVWIPDYRVTMCQGCTAPFTLTFRRHHCRACGKVVCDHCSANRAPLQYKRNQVARVCDGCFEVLQRDFQNKCDGSQRDEQMQSHFKRMQSGRGKSKKKVPERLMEVPASDASSQMSGYLRVLMRRSWHRGWFVLKDRVLYEYRASQDVKALYSLPVLGYSIQPMDKEVKEVTEDLDNCLAFQLSHSNQPPLLFQADSPHLAEKWIQAMKEAVVLT